MMKPVTTLALLLMALMPAAAAQGPIPAVKSVQCPPGHMVSGGYCTPLFRPAPTVAPKVRRCPNRLLHRGSSSCLEMPRR
jgi:hypothetical protein